MSSPSTAIKANRLVIRYLNFWSVRGDLQEGHDYGKRLGGYDKLLHDYASRWQFLSSLCQLLPSRSPLTSSRAQNRSFCALLGSGTPVFELFEHKNRLFVLFYPPEPPILGFSSTKSRFLCAFGVWNPCFQAFRAQNRGFCALFGFATLVFRLFEHKIGVFVRFRGLEPLFSRFPSTKSGFLCASYMVCWPGCGNSGLW